MENEMTRTEVLEKVQDIVRDAIDREDIILTPETTADDVEGWDSLVHIQIVAAIQSSFKIRFSALEMISWTNVGELCNAILSKL